MQWPECLVSARLGVGRPITLALVCVTCVRLWPRMGLFRDLTIPLDSHLDGYDAVVK